MAAIQPRQTSSPVYDQVLSLLRCALWGEENFSLQAVPDVSLEDIIQELKSQAVQFLVVDLLIQEDPGNADAYINSTAKNVIRWCNLMELQQAQLLVL